MNLLPPILLKTFHTVFGFLTAVFSVMLTGGFLQRAANRGDFRQKIAARKTILHAALALVVIVSLWLLLILTDEIYASFSGQKSVLGVFTFR